MALNITNSFDFSRSRTKLCSEVLKWPVQRWYHPEKLNKGKKLGLVKKNFKNNLSRPSPGQLKFTS